MYVCVYINTLERNYRNKFWRMKMFAFLILAPNYCPNWYALRNEKGLILLWFMYPSNGIRGRFPDN